MIRQWARLTVLGGTAITFVCAPAVTNAETNYKVAVNVHADDASSNELQSCINRELRTLGDVTLVSSDPQFTLQVIVFRPEVGGRRSAGLMASMVVLDHQDVRQLIRDARPKSLSSYRPRDSFVDTGDIATHYVMSDPTVAGLCKRIAANLDVDVIEAARRVDAMWVEAAKEMSKEKPE